ncbi:hypothetical protein TNCV_3147331 [Trichonephila clavipes]|nr:hypothetical protein TNCV_3147331 [Trichonephila clavipes]
MLVLQYGFNPFTKYFYEANVPLPAEARQHRHISMQIPLSLKMADFEVVHFDLHRHQPPSRVRAKFRQVYEIRGRKKQGENDRPVMRFRISWRANFTYHLADFVDPPFLSIMGFCYFFLETLEVGTYSLSCLQG